MYMSMCADLSSEATKPGKEELGEGEGKVLVEEVAEEGDHAVVGPAPVHQQQTLQVPAGEKRAQLHVHVHVLMRDERRKKERSKQRQTNKQGKAT